MGKAQWPVLCLLPAPQPQRLLKLWHVGLWGPSAVVQGVLWGRLAVGGEAMLGPGAQVEFWGRVAFQVAYQFYPPESKWLLFIEHMNE